MTTLTLKNQHGLVEPDWYAAVYSERFDDSEWEFVAAFQVGLITGDNTLYTEETADLASQVCLSVADGQMLQNDRLLVVFSGDPDFPSVYVARDDEIE